MASEGFTLFNHLQLDMIPLHDANTSIYSLTSLFGYFLLFSCIIQLKVTYVGVVRSVEKKLISCKSVA